ncbi:hypothetical protein J6E39_07510 [bacterium]|nr:hypothetical protein [bacterium]
MQISKTQRTETKRLDLNRYSYDNVTEFSFTTTRKLTDDAVLEVLKENGINLYGFISFTKQVVDFSIEQMADVFKYTAREVMC